MALNNLCWSKATANIELNSALDDCRAALKLEPDAGAFLDSLGMVLLRLGRLDEAMAAYDKAIDSRTGAASFMGRAIVRARKGDAVGAEADRASAAKLSTRIEEQFAGYDLRLSDEVSQATKEKTE